MRELLKTVEYYNIDPITGSKVLDKITETYKTYSEEEVNRMIDEAQRAPEYELIGHTTKYKPEKVTAKGIVKQDEHWLLTLKKQMYGGFDEADDE